MQALVLGHRQGLNQALEQLGIPYFLVTNHEIKFPPKGASLLQLDKYPLTPGELESFSERLSRFNFTPTHVIAATEAGVLPATYLRRLFNCRISKHSVIRKCALKSEMKKYLQEFDVPMTPFVLSSKTKNLDEISNAIGFPFVAKEINNSGGRGIVFVNQPSDFIINKKSSYIFEKFIDGSEGSVESFVQGGEILFTNLTEYFNKKFSNILPAQYSHELKEQIYNLNKLVIESLNISWGMTHLEFYQTAGGILFGEIALRPPGGYIMQLLKEAYDFNPWMAFASIELGLDFDFPKKAKSFAGCLVHHPGKGLVAEITTPSQASLKTHKIKVKIGDEIKDRAGVGEDIGYSIFVGSDIGQLKRDITELQNLPAISLA